jgi:hypothetical protein
MTLSWTIDPDKQLITAVAEGEVTRADMDAYLQAMAAAGAMTYRKLFDGSRGDTSMTPDDLLALGGVIRGNHRSGAMGPLAIVVPTSKMELMSRIIGMLAVADRPMRVFSETRPAVRWIEEQKPARAK